MNGEWVKYQEEGRRRLSEGTVRAFSWRDRREPLGASIRIARNSPEN
jgi:hypothetical protein